MTTRELSSTNMVERALHDEFYARQQRTDADLVGAAASSRLKLYRENPDRDFKPKQYQFFLLGDLSGMTVCDYACGDGENSILLASNGAAEIYAFDISGAAVELTRRRAALCGIGDRVKATLDNAEGLSCDSDSLDAIYGSAVLHHLDMQKAAREVKRVLKPGGRAVFCEPFQDSRFLALLVKFVFWVSRLKPDAVTPQRQLNSSDIELLEALFSQVNVRAFGIFNRVDRFFQNELLIARISRFDALLLKNFPFLRKYARHIVIECIK